MNRPWVFLIISGLCLTVAHAGTPIHHRRYLSLLRQSPPPIKKLVAETVIQRDEGGDIALDNRWLTGLPPQAVLESLALMRERAEVAVLSRDYAFEPREIRRRLSALLDRMYPNRIPRQINNPAEEPSIPTYDPVSDGTTASYPVQTSGTYYAGTSGTPVVVHHGSHQVVQGVPGGGYGGGTYVGQPSSSGGSSGGVATVVPGTTSGGGGNAFVPPPVPQENSAPVAVPQPVPVPKPRRVRRVPVIPPPVSVQRRETPPVVHSEVVQATVSQPTEVGVVIPPPLPPPPAPPPAPVVEPKKKEATNYWMWIVAALVMLLPLAIALYRRLRQKGTPPPPPPRPKSISDLLDPKDRGLDSAAIRRVGQASAQTEDWLKAMRYLFASLLTHLVEQRQVSIRDFHTNLEIASLLAENKTLAQSFWSAATVFELFWFGHRRPMENDFRLFETLVSTCLGSGKGAA